ncbi:hypothetical protein [Sphingomonas cavernae]|nr:hypothetical protein [Sphingomonas cavernae]
MTRITLSTSTLLLAALLALGACNDEPDQAELAKLDNSLAGNVTDPALAGALKDQIVVDPRRAGAVAVPGPRPSAAELGTLKRAPAAKATPDPVAPATLAAAKADGGKAGCMSGLGYNAAWAAKLPADLPLFPQARVSEAAGKDAAGCRARAITFATAADIGQVIDFYYTRATAAGFTAEHVREGQEHILGGTRDRDGGAYYLLARALPKGGTEVDLIANIGR